MNETRSCANCQQYSICMIREYFLSGKTRANEFIKGITVGPDGYAQLHSGMDKLIAENCRYYSDEKLD